MAHPSPTAKSFPIGARFTGKHRISYDVDTGELSESLPPIHGHAETIQRLLLTPLPAARRHTWVEKIGVFLPDAVSKSRPLNASVEFRFTEKLNPTTGVMQ